MTKAQRVVLAVGLLLFLVMGLFPPWEHRTDRYVWHGGSRHLAQVYTDTHYRFIAGGPQTGSSVAKVWRGTVERAGAQKRRATTFAEIEAEEEARTRPKDTCIRDVSARLDSTRLAVQWLTLAGLVGGVMFLLRPAGKTARRAGEGTAEERGT